VMSVCIPAGNSKGNYTNASIGDQVCKTGPPLPLDPARKNVLIVGDSVSIGYTPWVAEAMASTALVQHSPWGADGGAEETQFGFRCIDNLVRAPDGTPLSPDVLVFNWGLHNALAGNCTDPRPLPPSLGVADPPQCIFKPNCTMHIGTRAKGSASTKEECCTVCAAYEGCAAGIFDGSNCWFKTAVDVYEGCSPTSKNLTACINTAVRPRPPDCDPGQSGPPSDYAPYLLKIVNFLKTAPALAKTKLLFAITTPDMCDVPTNDLVEQLNKQAQQIMAAAGIPIVDLYGAITGECGPVPQPACFGSQGCFCPHCYGNDQLGYQWLTNNTIVPAIAKLLSAS